MDTRHFKVRMTLTLGIGLLGLISIGCRPDHLTAFDGKMTVATFVQTGTEPVRIRDDFGQMFELTSSQVTVKFEINRIGDSRLFVFSAGKKATFLLPKVALNKEGATFDLSHKRSNQTVDLHVEEKSTILNQWNKYRHDTSPIYTQSCSTDSNGNLNCYPLLVGFSDDYYLDTYGVVDRTVEVEIYESGASYRDFPEYLKRGELKMLVTHQTERLQTRSISYSEYRAAR